MKGDPLNTVSAYNSMLERQGGAFYVGSTWKYAEDSQVYVAATQYPDGFRPFIIGIYNQATNTIPVNLYFMVNPRDISLGQVQIVNPSYTRRGWLPVMWGMQQMSITATGKTGGFYYENPITGAGGITAKSRRDSIAFLNLMSLIAMIKNGGAYHLNKASEETWYRDGKSRVIHVMDQIIISYDRTEYIGSFSNFTVTETAESPYSFEYNFEFVVSGFRGEAYEGHLCTNGNEQNPEIEYGIQGSDLSFYDTVRLDESTLNDNLLIKKDLNETHDTYDWSQVEENEEYSFYRRQSDPEFKTGVQGNPVDPKTCPIGGEGKNLVKITRGGYDGESHNGKIDYRTTSGECRSLCEGTIFKIHVGGTGYGSSNYVIVKTKLPDGRMGYVRYYHLDPKNMTELKEGSPVSLGTFIGKEGTDGGKYAPHIDLELRVVSVGKGKNIDYSAGPREDVSDLFYKGVVSLNQAGRFLDYENIWHKHGTDSCVADVGVGVVSPMPKLASEIKKKPVV